MAHMSENKLEEKYVKEAFDTNWVVPMGPNVNAFEKELEKFVASLKASPNPPLKGRANIASPNPPLKGRANIASPNPPLKGRANDMMNCVIRDYGVHTADPVMYGLLKEFAEENRKNPTLAESVLWNALKGNGIGLKFRRQHIIEDFVVDFFCYEKKLTIELDGGYHNAPAQMKNDAERKVRLNELGYTELRFSNEQVLADIDAVLKKIIEVAESLPLGGDIEEALICPSEGYPEEAPSRRVVCLSAGTAAVHLALIGCGVKAGDEVLVQSFTFCASSHPITYLGAKPVFVGSEGVTWNMDPALLEKAIIDRKEKTGKYPKAIVPVALYGMPYLIDEIMAIANKYGIPVIEDAAEGMGSRFNGQVLGTFGKYGVLSFNGNKMITTSGGGALICHNDEDANNIMWYATQARDAYPYYQHTAIGYNYRMSNVCAGIGRGQMTVLNDHIAHHKHVQALYEELLKDVQGVHIHKQPTDHRYDANFWLCAATLDADVKIQGQENAYKEVIKTAVGGAAGVIHAVDSAVTDCQPNENVEALRVFMLSKKIECRPVWKPMHKQPVYADAPVYTNGIEEEIFKVGFCLPAGPWVTDEDVRYIVESIKEAIVK